MSDWCIENDFAAQREQAELYNYVNDALRNDLREYKDAIEWEMGSDWADRILEKYRNRKL